MRGITKRFPGVLANDAVDFEAAPGEVHALLGENGAGKSTLSNILTGLYRPDEGEISLYGRPARFNSPSDAIEAGIGMVHQHFRLVSPFTVAENIVLGEHREEARSFVLHPRQIERRVAELEQRYGLALDPGARVWQLSVGEQQRVEILKVLYRELADPDPRRADRGADAAGVGGPLRDVADDGRGGADGDLHLPQAAGGEGGLRPGDRAARREERRDRGDRGRHVARARRADGRAGGRAGPAPGAGQSPVREEPALEVDALSVRGDRGEEAVRGLSFAIRCGEILGVAGVAGNGQRELAEAVTGMRPAAGGAVRVEGVRLRTGDPRAAIAAGIAHVPEDRLGTGVAPSLTIAENSVLKTYRRAPASRGPLLDWRKIRGVARRVDRALPTCRHPGRTRPCASSPAATCRSSCSAASSQASRTS